jgi:sodium transport system permease protein
LTVGVQGVLTPMLARELGGGLLNPLKLTPIASASAAKQQFGVAIEVPANLPDALGAPPATIKIYVHDTDRRFVATVALIESGVARYNQALLQKRLAELGIDKAAMQPLATRIIRPESAFNFNVLGFIVPLFLSIWTIVGGQATALDATVGERERQTLESLFSAPVRRVEVLLGKFLAVFCFGLLSGICGLLGFLLTALVIKFGVQQLFGTLATTFMSTIGAQIGLKVVAGPAALVALLVMVLSLAAALSALVLLPCIFARTSKEAQFYLAPSMILAVGAAMLVQLKIIVPNFSALYWLPLSGSIACAGDALANTVQIAHLLSALLSNALFTAALLGAALFFLQRERVVFRSS